MKQSDWKRGWKMSRDQATQNLVIQVRALGLGAIGELGEGEYHSVALWEKKPVIKAQVKASGSQQTNQGTTAMVQMMDEGGLQWW